MQNFLLVISSVLVTLGPLSYIQNILYGKTRPHRMTRFILGFVLTINFISILAAKSNLGAQIFAGITCVQALVIFFLSLKKGIGGASTFDWACLSIAVIGIIGWKITGNPVISIWFAVFADFVAYLPAFIKTWRHPSTESPGYYLLSGLAAFLSLIAYKIQAASIFQLYIIFCAIVMLGLIYRQKILKSFA